MQSNDRSPLRMLKIAKPDRNGNQKRTLDERHQNPLHATGMNNELSLAKQAGSQCFGVILPQLSEIRFDKGACPFSW